MIDVPPGYLWNNTGRPLVICMYCGAMVMLTYVKVHDQYHAMEGDVDGTALRDLPAQATGGC